MKTAYFDIESSPLSDDQLALVKPEFKAPANYRDPVKIAESVKEQEAAWKERAALDATTGRVLAIGVLDGGIFDAFTGDEQSILRAFWTWLDVMQLQLSHSVVGFAIFHFDLPFLARRSWIIGVPVPVLVLRSNRWHPWSEQFVDIAANWQCGNKDQRVSLDVLAKSLGVGAKNGSGGEFAKLYSEDQSKALDYLRNDLELTRKCWERMNYSQI